MGKPRNESKVNFDMKMNLKKEKNFRRIKDESPKFQIEIYWEGKARAMNQRLIISCRISAIIHNKAKRRREKGLRECYSTLIHEYQIPFI